MKMKYGEAIRQALHDELENDPNVVLMGQDIQHNIYGYTGELLRTFGPRRVRNTPISEAAVVGTAIGSAMCGLRPIIDLTVANFLYVAMDQLASMAAKMRYMYDGQFKVPITVLVGTLYNTNSAAQHSDRPHPAIMNIPGLKAIAPASPQDAYSMLRGAVRDDNPVICFMDRNLFYSEQIVDRTCVAEIGKAALLAVGKDLTIVSIGGMTKSVIELLPELSKRGISVEVIDVRSLTPLDIKTISTSVRKTGRAVIVDTANRTCSAASEISSRLVETEFAFLRAPIGIVAYDDVPVPFAKCLERQIMPTSEKILLKVLHVMGYGN